MPTVATGGRLRFKVCIREHSPPHVHVWDVREYIGRINLDDGKLMDSPPPGMERHILEAYRRHAATIRAEWDRIHGS